MADWMSELAVAACERPIITLAIPGSHLSATSCLKEDGEIAPDQAWCVRALNDNDMIRKAVYNWSRVQIWSIKEQLEAGIRFLDVQVAYINNSFYVVHGLCAIEIRDLFNDVNNYITAHPKEVIITDINHFYDFNETRHQKLLDMIEAIFDERLLHRPSTVQTLLSYTLNKIWSDTGRVIIFYQPPIPSIANDLNGNAGPSEILKLPKYVWSRDFITSPWPKTEEANKMISEVAEIIKNRELEDGFQVCQAIVTLTVNSIIRQPTGTFEMRYGRRATRALVGWLRQSGWNHKADINVILADFVDEDHFCDVVIDLNR